MASMAAHNNTYDGQDVTTTAPSSVISCHSEADYYAALALAGDRLVVVDCYASWCPPCRQIAPVFSALALHYTDVVFLKVDMEAAPGLKGALGVWALPTFLFFRYGKKVGSFMGANERLLRRGLEHNGEVSMCSSLPCIVQ
jgi:thioredoxin 1